MDELFTQYYELSLLHGVSDPFADLAKLIWEIVTRSFVNWSQVLFFKV